jgi:hypothetical protein
MGAGGWWRYLVSPYSARLRVTIAQTGAKSTNIIRRERAFILVAAFREVRLVDRAIHTTPAAFGPLRTIAARGM